VADCMFNNTGRNAQSSHRGSDPSFIKKLCPHAFHRPVFLIPEVHDYASYDQRDMNPFHIAVDDDVAFWSRFLQQEVDQASTWSESTGGVQHVLEFNSVLEGPVTVSTVSLGF
jgi:hypothetical protein